MEPVRVELTTSRLQGGCSSQLSYDPRIPRRTRRNTKPPPVAERKLPCSGLPFRACKYRKRDSNPHTSRYNVLSVARLPFPPFLHIIGDARVELAVSYSPPVYKTDALTAELIPIITRRNIRTLFLLNCCKRLFNNTQK